MIPAGNVPERLAERPDGVSKRSLPLWEGTGKEEHCVGVCFLWKPQQCSPVELHDPQMNRSGASGRILPVPPAATMVTVLFVA